MISHLTLANAVAWAADVDPAAGGSPNPIMSFLPIIAIFAVMYFLMIRPQQKKQKEHQAMLSAIQKGDKIQTSGGIIGTVTGLDTNDLTVEIAPQVRVKVGRGFVARVIRPTVETPPPSK
ncbi:preprotein translocase subunit YajC [Deltaproteobacteria bacterium Smac51]|nr:preprotein translocase subunit YajC [Deltaproteobacteria bacterium Smac51]